jgi:ribosomal protein L11 methylase PrmA
MQNSRTEIGVDIHSGRSKDITTPTRDTGSFRDPAGYVFSNDREIFRTINSIALDDFTKVRASGVIEELVSRGLLIRSDFIDNDAIDQNTFIGARGEIPEFVIRHPKVPFISYPYEWTFEQLKDAALAHLDLQIRCLEYDIALSDATPYNMQFFEGSFRHIDLLSLKPYVEGEPWRGYNQFCRLFLAPLLVEAWVGIPFQPMLRGQIDGLDLHEVSRILPKLKVWSSINALLHISFQSKVIARASSTKSISANSTRAFLPKSRFKALLLELQRWISSLSSGRNRRSYWSDYASDNTYNSETRRMKLDFIREWALKVKGGLIWDIGGNTGDFSKAALEGGASLALIFDSDIDSLEKAYEDTKRGVSILPLLVDIANPSPQQGWNQRERAGLNERSRPAGLIALAVIHHLAIGRNLPLREVIRWLVDAAPEGIIEFVPKSDPMIVEMLFERDDVFIDYSEEHFLSYLSEMAVISDSIRLPDNGRFIVSFSRK